MSGWSWDDECMADWGAECDWAGEEWVDWEGIEDEDFGFDDDYGFDEFCAEFGDDPICASGGGDFEWTEYCASSGAGWSLGSGSCVA